MKILYTLGLYCLACIYLPQALYQRLCFGKYKGVLLQRFGIKIPKLAKPCKKVVWIHACSIGETKAASTLAPYYKDAHLIISNTTETGHVCAKKCIPYAAEHIYLPFDFRWAIRRLFKQIKPDLLILIESDIWLNFLSEAKCHTVLASGVLSERSWKRYKKFLRFAKQLLEPIDQFLVQNTTYQKRFAELGIKAQVTGNLKYDLPVPQAQPEDFLITIASTHEGEEELLISALEPLIKKYPALRLQIVPRHPERFERVVKLLKNRQVKVITQMHALSECYAKSRVAIVGGSFIPHVGGHNILEPIQCGIPTFFGPHMHAQSELAQLAQPAGGLFSIDAIERCLTSPEYSASLSQAALQLAASLRGTAQQTFQAIARAISPNPI